MSEHNELMKLNFAASNFETLTNMHFWLVLLGQNICWRNIVLMEKKIVNIWVLIYIIKHRKNRIENIFNLENFLWVYQLSQHLQKE